MLFVLLGLGIFMLLAVLLVAMPMISTYNTLVSQNEQVDAQWKQVENQYQRRADLIPNLVETVKGYAKQENEIFTNIANARARIGSAQTRGQRMEAESEMSGFLSRLLMISENYPQLKSNENFTNLMVQLEGTENRITVERMKYNEEVQKYNLMVKRFPGNLMAGFLGFEAREYFEADAGTENAPKVDFGGASGAAAPEPATGGAN
ncbi:MAG: LemA family protein [bacterium]|nr:LemA family protein [bacterium]